jgi:hypothetical protein
VPVGLAPQLSTSIIMASNGLLGLSYNATARIVDEADGSLVYSGNWTHERLARQQYNSTRSGTTSAGAKVTFHFNGTLCSGFLYGAD